MLQTTVRSPVASLIPSRPSTATGGSQAKSSIRSTALTGFKLVRTANGLTRAADYRPNPSGNSRHGAADRTSLILGAMLYRRAAPEATAWRLALDYWNPCAVIRPGTARRGSATWRATSQSGARIGTASIRRRLRSIQQDRARAVGGSTEASCLATLLQICEPRSEASSLALVTYRASVAAASAAPARSDLATAVVSDGRAALVWRPTGDK